MASKPRRHQPVRPAARRHNPVQENRQAKRALPTSSSAWRELRAKVLDAEPYCRGCRKRGVAKLASQVDHEDGNSCNNELWNLQPLCASCHSRKTAMENGGFGHLEIMPSWLPKPACRLFVVCGPPGAGKSTHVAKNAAPGDVILDTDQISRQVYGRPLHQLTKPELALVFARRNRTLAALSNAEPSSVAWLIATAGSFRQRKFWTDLGAEVVVLFPGILECINRVQADPGRCDARKRSNIAAIQRWK